MECPVCHQPNLAEEITRCPNCKSELTGFKELAAAESERDKRKKTVKKLIALSVLIVIGWGVSASMMSKYASTSEGEKTLIQQKIESQAQNIIDLKAENEALAMRNDVLEEQFLSVEVIELSEDGETIEKDYLVHVVKEGESLWSIAEEYHSDGFKHEEIAGHNELNDPHYIKVGDTVIIKK
jgi:nucleoid-associated protein YgaU|tara:strand:+ start:1004 stop:1549 length:546 start_codon:yes stop_codon:yes gene_type:complete